jgi:hypothetical protein
MYVSFHSNQSVEIRNCFVYEYETNICSFSNVIGKDSIIIKNNNTESNYVEDYKILT